MEVKLAKLDSLRVQLSEAQQTIVAKDREIENYKTEFLTLHEKIDELEQIKVFLFFIMRSLTMKASWLCCHQRFRDST